MFTKLTPEVIEKMEITITGLMEAVEIFNDPDQNNLDLCDNQYDELSILILCQNMQAIIKPNYVLDKKDLELVNHFLFIYNNEFAVY